MGSLGSRSRNSLGILLQKCGAITAAKNHLFLYSANIKATFLLPESKPQTKVSKRKSLGVVWIGLIKKARKSSQGKQHIALPSFSSVWALSVLLSDQQMRTRVGVADIHLVWPKDDQDRDRRGAGELLCFRSPGQTLGSPANLLHPLSLSPMVQPSKCFAETQEGDVCRNLLFLLLWSSCQIWQSLDRLQIEERFVEGMRGSDERGRWGARWQDWREEASANKWWDETMKVAKPSQL